MRSVCKQQLVGAFAVLALSAGVASANGDQATSESTRKPPPIDEQAIEALEKMGAFLREQENFTVSMKTDTDYVTETGQKLTVRSYGSVHAERPDHLRAEVVSDRKHRQFFYDGEKFTMFSPVLGLYTTLEAPPTIGELADTLQTRFDIGLPLVDLFRWGAEDPDFSDITAARYVGPATIDGVKTDQYAFRQRGVDWQLWIESGETPVPRKLVITTTDDRARPEHAIEMSWKLGTEHPDTMFTFEPPEGTAQIAIEETGGAPSEIEDTTRAKRSARRDRR